VTAVFVKAALLASASPRERDPSRELSSLKRGNSQPIGEAWRATQPSISSTRRTRSRPRRRARDAARAPGLAGPSADDPLKLYVRQIGDGRLLTPGQERELARRKDLGDEAAKRKLIESNLRLVMSITRNYTRATCRCST
jgi:DNA-directed RNA polymerase sigma subunit (sigma70/sigma32)